MFSDLQSFRKGSEDVKAPEKSFESFTKFSEVLVLKINLKTAQSWFIWWIIPKTQSSLKTEPILTISHQNDNQ